jgi:hypothetical protein
LNVVRAITGNIPYMGNIGTSVLQSFAMEMLLPANPFVVGVSRALNATVVLAGLFFEYAVCPVMRVFRDILEAVKEIFEALPFVKVPSSLRWIINFLNNSLNTFHNLYEASQGRPGG